MRTRRKQYDYSTFEGNVAYMMDGLNSISVGALSECPEHGEDCSDTEFTRYECDHCGMTFAGKRYAAHARDDEDDEIVHLDVCEDCVMYIAYGEVPKNWARTPYDVK